MTASDDADRQDARDIGRMAKLEKELQRLLAAVDARLKDAPPMRRPTVESRDDMAWLYGPKGPDRRLVLAAAGAAVVLFAAGWGGSSLYYGFQLKAHVEDEIRPYAAELADTVATIQTDLGPQMALADELKAEIDQARRDLLARDEELEATIAEAQTQLLSIRDNAIDDIERRLSDQTDDLSVMIEMSRQRAIELDQGLQEVSRTLDGFDHQLPALTEGLAELAAKLVENRTILDRAAEEIAALDGKAPPLLQAVETHQESLEGGSQTLAVLQAQLEALKTQTVRSSHQLDQVLDEGRARVADWESVEREIDQRKQGIMQNLDHYADSLNARVREFIEVLNNAPTFTGG